MKNLRLLALLLVLVTAFVSCKKDKDPAPPTKTELLTAKSWKNTASTVNPAVEYRIPQQSGDTISLFVKDYFVDLYNKVGLSCRTDDIIRFVKTPNNYTREEGATACTPGKSILETGTWTFNGDETVLALSVPGYSPDNYTVQQLDATTLILVSTVTTSNNTTYTFTDTYTNQ